MTRPIHEQLRIHAVGLDGPVPIHPVRADLMQIAMLDAAELLDPADDELLARLAAARADLAELDHEGRLHQDLGMAIARIRLAERAAHEALGRRDLLRPTRSSS